MARILRTDFPGALHHLFGRGNGKQAIFRAAEDFRSFLIRLSDLKREAGFRLFAFCLMTNHYHLLLETGAMPLCSVMHRLLTGYARTFNDRWGLVGHPFQGRYGARLINGENDLRSVIRYIHLNPVEAGLTCGPGEWPWSSHSALLNGDSSLIDTRFVLDLFEGDLHRYNSFLAEPVRQEILPSLGEIAERFGGRDRLRSRHRHPTEAEARRDFAEAARELGYRQSQIAVFLDRTPAAVSLLLRGTT